MNFAVRLKSLFARLHGCRVTRVLNVYFERHFQQQKNCFDSNNCCAFYLNTHKLFVWTRSERDLSKLSGLSIQALLTQYLNFMHLIQGRRNA